MEVQFVCPKCGRPLERETKVLLGLDEPKIRLLQHCSKCSYKSFAVFPVPAELIEVEAISQ